jgi:UDP-glucose 4-epimerase
MKNKRWLITGGCGFIGINLVAHLKEAYPDINISILDNLSVGSRRDLAKVCSFNEADAINEKAEAGQVHLIVGDIRDFKTCLGACKGIDVVIHLAANTGVPPSIENPREDMEANVIGTFNMLEASRENGVKKFIFASSGAPVGEIGPPIHEEKAPRPVSPYGASKLAGEGYCSAYYRTFGLKTVSLRFGNVYGPRSNHKSSVVAKFFKRALNSEPLEIFGDGSQTRDFIYIDDLIQAIMLSVKSDIGGEVFQIATHKETTVKEIASLIKDIVEREAGKKVDIIHSNPRQGDVKRNYSDISKAKEVLGYEPKFDIHSGLQVTYNYFKDNLV